MGARISYMKDVPQPQRKRSRRPGTQTFQPFQPFQVSTSRRTTTECKPSACQLGERAEEDYQRTPTPVGFHLQPGELSDDTEYPLTPGRVDPPLSAVSSNPEHPPGLFALCLEKNSGSNPSLVSTDSEISSENHDQCPAADKPSSDGHYIPVLDGHLNLWIPQNAVVQPRTPQSPTDVVSDASETRVLYSASGDINGALDMIIFVEQIYVRHVPGDNLSALLPEFLSTSTSDPFSMVTPVSTQSEDLDGIDARFLTPTVDKGNNHIRRVLLWNKGTGGVMQRLSVFLTDEAALHRARQLAVIAQRVVTSVTSGSNTFNLSRRRQAIDFLNVEGAERLMLEVELPENMVWTIDESPAGSKMVCFHKVGHGDDKNGRIVLNLGQYHSSKCAPCLADDIEERCIVFGRQAQWRSLRARGKASHIHKCCVTVPLSSGPREVHLYFKHVSETLDIQFKQLVQSMSWMTAPKLEN